MPKPKLFTVLEIRILDGYPNNIEIIGFFTARKKALEYIQNSKNEEVNVIWIWALYDTVLDDPDNLTQTNCKLYSPNCTEITDMDDFKANWNRKKYQRKKRWD